MRRSLALCLALLTLVLASHTLVHGLDCCADGDGGKQSTCALCAHPVSGNLPEPEAGIPPEAEGSSQFLVPAPDSYPVGTVRDPHSARGPP